MQLIAIKNENGKQLVSARELYEFLGFDKSQWARWSNKNIAEETFFAENEDWTRLDIMSNGNETVDYVITIDMAKELSMLARTEKGKQARKYFIECEKTVKSAPLMSIEDIMIRSLQEQKELKNRVEAIEHKVETQITLDHAEQHKFHKAIKHRVCQRVEAITVANSRLIFSAIHRDIRDRFGVTSYKDVKRQDLELAIAYVNSWIEKAELRA